MEHFQSTLLDTETSVDYIVVLCAIRRHNWTSNVQLVKPAVLGP